MPSRVLFIQDDDHTRKRVRDLLEAGGFVVEDTSSAIDGLNTATAGPIALSDFGMPGTVHEVYIRFVSDGGYSDEDGNYPSAWNAGLVVDNISVTGTLTYTEDFEAALNPNVSFVNTAPATPFGEWARLYLMMGEGDQVAGTMGLEQLHFALQVAVGWMESHLHEFRIGRRRFGAADPEGAEGRVDAVLRQQRRQNREGTLRNRRGGLHSGRSSPLHDGGLSL